MQWPDLGVENPATEGPPAGLRPTSGQGAEVLLSAFAIRTRDSRYTPGVVATLEERLDGLADAIEAEAPQALRKLLEARGELGEVRAEEPLERACAPLAIGARGRRIQGEGELVWRSGAAMPA